MGYIKISSEPKHDLITQEQLDESEKHKYEMILKGLQVADYSFWVTIGGTNHVAYTYLLDVIDELEERKMLRFKRKKIVGDIQRIYRKYLLGVKEELREAQRRIEEKRRKMLQENPDMELHPEANKIAFWINVCIQVEEFMQSDIDVYESTCREYLDKFTIKHDKGLIAKILCASELMELSCMSFDAYFDNIAKTVTEGEDISKFYSRGRLTRIKGLWDELVKDLKLSVPDDCKPFNDYKVRKRYKKIVDHLKSEKRFENISDAVFKLHDIDKEKYEETLLILGEYGEQEE